MSIAIDQEGNVLVAPLWNLLFLKRGAYPFGNPDETISSVLGKNKLINAKTKPLEALSNTLDAIDPNHVTKSIDHTEDNKEHY